MHHVVYPALLLLIPNLNILIHSKKCFTSQISPVVWVWFHASDDKVGFLARHAVLFTRLGL